MPEPPNGGEKSRMLRGLEFKAYCQKLMRDWKFKESLSKRFATFKAV
ncbi:hypothetical protein COLO4_22171 [Corchorus olitorius]|uniref:Uncharacterized protein n=1 Tax=Corchorus olitorius TaxID=93759 RepID=A0A1R3INM9_9ROSI|nr:hypothetical protein COLO4_22171 [Corchorus olitorius]